MVLHVVQYRKNDYKLEDKILENKIYIYIYILVFFFLVFPSNFLSPP